MVLVDASVRPVAASRFEAEVVIIRHQEASPTKIRERRFECVVHTQSMRQTARIESMDRPLSRRGDRAKCVFRFVNHVEYLRESSTILFLEGSTRTQGVGRITRVFRGED